MQKEQIAVLKVKVTDMVQLKTNTLCSISKYWNIACLYIVTSQSSLWSFDHFL